MKNLFIKFSLLIVIISLIIGNVVSAEQIKAYEGNTEFIFLLNNILEKNYGISINIGNKSVEFENLKLEAEINPLSGITLRQEGKTCFIKQPALLATFQIVRSDCREILSSIKENIDMKTIEQLAIISLFPGSLSIYLGDYISQVVSEINDKEKIKNASAQTVKIINKMIASSAKLDIENGKIFTELFGPVFLMELGKEPGYSHLSTIGGMALIAIADEMSREIEEEEEEEEVEIEEDDSGLD
ncbi:MAG: hypothetical protein ABIA04_00820 [Pseudomonadota bacterium]